MTSRSAETKLQLGIKKLGLTLSQEQKTQLLDYLALMEKWSKTYNLTAIKSLDDMVTLHLLDSLSVSSYLEGDEVLDVGTGAGLPGLPLAIANPDKTFYLLDSNNKKIRFIQQVKIALKLKNVEMFWGRIENHLANNRYGTIISRAFSSLDDFANLCQRPARHNSLLIAMKGKKAPEELAAFEKQVKECRVEQLQVPFLDAERHLVMFRL